MQSLIAAAAPDIAEWMEPDTRDVDLGPVERIWSGIKKADLPEDFRWEEVARNYSRAIQKQFRDNPTLRDAYNIILQQRQTIAIERLAGPDPGFDLTAYRQFLIEKKCNALQLAVMHSSTYGIRRQGHALEHLRPPVRARVRPDSRNPARDSAPAPQRGLPHPIAR